MEKASDQLLQLVKQRVNETLPMLKHLVCNLQEKMKELLPSMIERVITLWEKTMSEGLPLLRKRGIILWEKARSEGLPMLKEKGIILWEKARSEGLPMVKSASGFLVEKIKLHPWASAFAVLVLLLYFTGRGGPPVKMMKAPGRNYRIPRKSFQQNPKGYFRDLRGNN